VATTSGRQALIIAGPNGAGKTTFARRFLPAQAVVPTFVNADLIAEQVSPLAPERAAIHSARLMIEAIRGHVERGEDFALETTLAGRAYARAIPRWRALGYRVELIFLALPSPEVAIARVAQRIRQGGHAVPDDIIRRRFFAGRENFETLYRPLVDAWALFDNSGEEPILVGRGENR
jgi:predicted ABC-type ATPase